MGVALAMTVRDERELLRTNLLYHRHLGVDLALVYDDGSADGTAVTVADLGFCRVQPTVSIDWARKQPGMERLVAAYHSHFTARQLINVAHAMAAARDAGLSWLALIDADELLVVDHHSAAPGQLWALLDDVPADTSAVVFPPLEVVQRRESYDDVVVEERLFKRPDTGATRPTFDPFRRLTHDIGVVYGHTAGKSAVRLSAPIMPSTAHRFARADGKPLKTMKTGSLLHYYCHDFATFLSKFRLMRDHPDRHIRGDEVVLQKRLWRDVVNRSGLDEAGLRDYYRRWVMFDDERVARLRAGGLRRRPTIVEVESASALASQLQGRHAG